MASKYPTFGHYLRDKYYNLIFSRLNVYIINNKNRLSLSHCSITDAAYVKLEDFYILGISYQNTDDDSLIFHAVIRAEVAVSGKSRRDYDCDGSDDLFKISFTGLLHDGLQNLRITNICEYTREKFKAEDTLTKFLVPYVHAKDLDKYAEKFLKKYCRRALDTPMAIPVRDVLKTMGLTMYNAPLPNGIFSQTYFADAHVEIFDRVQDVVETDIGAGTILIDPDISFMRNVGSENNTIIHECVHWDMHHKFFELQKLLNPEYKTISCAIVEDYKEKEDPLAKELDWMEWQANAIAPKILMPARTTREKLNTLLHFYHSTFPSNTDASIMQLAISDLSEFFQVSTFAAKLRAIELGFDQAVGVFNYIDNRYHEPFSFKKGTLTKDQTFIIDIRNALFEASFNDKLREPVDNGLFVHADGMFVINDPKYLKFEEGKETKLTAYALAHVDECCLIFNRKTRISKHYDDSYYRICFLCRNADSKSFVEATYNSDEPNNQATEERAKEMQAIRAEAARIVNIGESALPISFGGTLDAHITRKDYSNERLSGRTGISDRTIRDYRNKINTKPTLQSVLALGIGLNLQPIFFFDLINKAGYNIMTMTEENIIIRYMINNHHTENIDMWNEKLKDAGIDMRLPRNGIEGEIFSP